MIQRRGGKGGTKSVYYNCIFNIATCIIFASHCNLITKTEKRFFLNTTSYYWAIYRSNSQLLKCNERITEIQHKKRICSYYISINTWKSSVFVSWWLLLGPWLFKRQTAVFHSVTAVLSHQCCPGLTQAHTP